MSKEMREQINRVKNWEQFLNESKLDDMISKSEKSNKESCLRTILNRGNLMLNKHDKIEWDGDILKIGIAYFDYGQGTKILSFLKHRSFFFNYWVDFKNKKLYDKNMLGGTYDLTEDELDKISNKYYWFRK
jgi:hypothetical protein